MAAAAVTGATPELADIQGLVARGYGDLPRATFLLSRIADGPAARQWLGGVVDLITPADRRPERRAVNLAFTRDGLARLGVRDETLALFSNPFVEGMTTPHRRRALGDVGPDAPEHWSWGGPSERVDLVLLLYATDSAELAALRAEPALAFPPAVELVRELGTSDLRGLEPFGFRDGISQPIIEGLSKAGPAATTLKFGEFVLGYPNEYGRYTDRHLLAEAPRLGRNGSYLVFRQLRQDVRGFWRYLDEAARRPDGTLDRERRLRLAAKLVGRWPSGAPLALAPDHDDASLAEENDFGYFEHDRDGTRCPVGAHIRRTNPRDSLDPRPGTEKSLAINRRHRVLRRGREYGQQLSPEEAQREPPPEEERGLHFICLNANIARQFEFIQSTWMNSPKFAGLYDDSDPLTGPSQPYGGTFTIPTDGLRERLTGMPRFISMRGGAYFFLPGLTASRYVAGLAD
jgi:Dyp-type peroxidase family